MSDFDPLAVKIQELLDKGVSEADIDAMSADEILGPGPWRDGYVKPESKKADVPKLPEQQKPGFLAAFMDSPLEALKSVPERVESVPGVKEAGAFMKGVNDRFTLGLWPMFERAIGTEEQSQALAQESPTANALGAGTGMGLSAVLPFGPAAQAGRAATGIVNAATPRLASSAAGRVVQGGLSGSLAGAGLGAAEGGAEGAAIGAATGGLLGGGLSGAGEAAKKIIDSKGGKARQLIEQFGGKVGLTTPGKGGPFENQLKGRKPIDRDIGEVSRESAVRILKRLDDVMESEKAPFLQQKGVLDKSTGKSLDVTALVRELEDLTRSERLSDSELATVGKWIGRLQKYREGDAYMMPASKLNDFRGLLQESTNVGVTPDSVAKAKLQGASGAAKDLVDTTPYGEVNAGIHGASNKYEEARRQLSLKDKPNGGVVAPEGVPEEEIAKIANMMSREQQNTVSAGVRNADRLQRFAQQFPEHAADIQMPRLLERQGDLTFRLTPGERGGLIERTKSALEGPAAAAALGGGLGYLGGDAAMGAQILGGAKLLNDLRLLNAAAINGRILYTPAQQAGLLFGGLPSGPGGTGGALAPYAIDPIFNLLSGAEVQRRKNERKEQD